MKLLLSVLIACNLSFADGLTPLNLFPSEYLFQIASSHLEPGHLYSIAGFGNAYDMKSPLHLAYRTPDGEKLWDISQKDFIVTRSRNNIIETGVQSFVIAGGSKAGLGEVLLVLPPDEKPSSPNRKTIRYSFTGIPQLNSVVQLRDGDLLFAGANDKSVWIQETRTDATRVRSFKAFERSIDNYPNAEAVEGADGNIIVVSRTRDSRYRYGNCLQIGSFSREGKQVWTNTRCSTNGDWFVVNDVAGRSAGGIAIVGQFTNKNPVETHVSPDFIVKGYLLLVGEDGKEIAFHATASSVGSFSHGFHSIVQDPKTESFYVAGAYCEGFFDGRPWAVEFDSTGKFLAGRLTKVGKPASFSSVQLNPQNSHPLFTEFRSFYSGGWSHHSTLLEWR